MPLTPTPKIWMDGELVAWEDATVHVLTHSLHYGMGVFEGIRAYPTSAGPAVFRLTDHVNRLFSGAHILGIEIPFSPEDVSRGIKAVVAASGLGACYIRPIVYLGYGEMGLNPIPCGVNVAIACWPWGAYLGDEGVANGIRLKISSWARHDPRAMPTAAKGTGMYINSSLAKVEAVRAGYDEALMLTTDGHLSEGTGENVFLVRHGQVMTPLSSSVGALEGITAATVRRLLEDLGIGQVQESLLRRTDLYTAEEAFLTGTAAEIVPIASVDDRVVGAGVPGPVTKALQAEFNRVVRGEVDSYKDWVEHVT